MAKGKEISSKPFPMIKAGPTGLVGKQSKTGTQVPGQTAQMGRNGQVAKGGGNKMAGKGAARPAKPGVTASN
jgi:hypothetical protein